MYSTEWKASLVPGETDPGYLDSVLKYNTKIYEKAAGCVKRHSSRASGERKISTTRELRQEHGADGERNIPRKTFLLICKGGSFWRLTIPIYVAPLLEI